jgi:AraC-like DNA-binding protein
MQPAHFLPPASLAPYVAFYGIWDIEDDFSEPYVSPPLGLCGLILCLESRLNAKLNGNLFLKDDYCATGQVTAPMTGDIKGKTKTLLVFINPFGLHQLFGIDMSQLANTSIPLSELLGTEEAQDLIQKLQSAPDHKGLIDVTNEFLLAQQPVFEIAPKVKQALEYIHLHKGNVTIKDIERNCFITSRSLERHFKVYIGLSPKDYVKIFQFKCLLNYINENPGMTWAKLCEQNGYYDQSHLTRYFTKYLKAKPGELVNMDMELISYLLQ